MAEIQETKIVQFCGKCAEERTFVREFQERSVDIRGERITARVPELVCEVCHDVQPDMTPGADAMRPFYDAYRQQHNLLRPGDITRIREKYGLSREALASILGMSAATLYRYESGALQDDLHDALLRAYEHPGAMEGLVENRKERLSDLQMRRFQSAIKALMPVGTGLHALIPRP